MQVREVKFLALLLRQCKWQQLGSIVILNLKFVWVYFIHKIFFQLTIPRIAIKLISSSTEERVGFLRAYLYIIIISKLNETCWNQSGTFFRNNELSWPVARLDAWRYSK